MKYLLLLILTLLRLTSAKADEQNSFSIGESDCRVMNSSPRQNERITWSGACKDGYADGNGVLQWYIGDVASSRFEGRLEHGRPHGVGTYIYENNSRYEGGFFAGKKKGQGIMTNPNGDTISGLFENEIPVGVFDIRFKNGASYSGEINSNRQFEGKGKLIYNDGASYIGDFKDGKRNGQGEMTYNDGARYVGSFKNGQRSGLGLLKYSDGAKYTGAQYEGEFKLDLKEGRGIFVDTVGTRYEGEWKAGYYDGVGSIIYAQGGRYDGQWKAGKYDGKGIVVYPGGRRVEGEFKNGAPLGLPIEKVRADKQYSMNVRDINTGRLEFDRVVGSDVPFDKSYEQLTADERGTVKSKYPLMDEGDEPPYPLNGTQNIYKWLTNAEDKLHIDGRLTLHVYVGSDGNAESVTIFGSPSPEMTKVASIIVMNEKYKPGKCEGTPCAMIFPFSIKFSANRNK
ncbi:energy transducer TonB [Undibacterium sp. Ren11W]|uniref:energy transducer TonB n=1 Tax=Undibacterium sp. Ren11W TaxID=3413045 RepID=UPI003BF13B0C